MVPLFPPKIAFLMTVHQISGFVYTWTKAAQKLIVQIKKKNRLSQLSFSPLLALFSLSQRRPLHPLRRLSDGHRLGVLHGRLGLGGIAIVHYNNTPFDQYSIIRSAKSRRIPFASDTIFKSPSDFVDSGDDFASSPCVFVTQNGDSKSELLGLVSRSYGVRVGDCMEAAAAAGSSRYDFDKAASFLARNAPLVSGEDGEVVDVFSAKDVERIRGFPKLGLPSLGPMGISWWARRWGRGSDRLRQVIEKEMLKVEVRRVKCYDELKKLSIKLLNTATYHASRIVYLGVGTLPIVLSFVSQNVFLRRHRLHLHRLLTLTMIAIAFITTANWVVQFPCAPPSAPILTIKSSNGVTCRLFDSYILVCDGVSSSSGAA
ncbi:hypothetical protein Syun_011287 [Stephania yunnanensis]|uniref:Uncharacterized protein n=1 Tax=Stephania yunnanensis TaxID=152371 RepID=A0AAP0JZM7_9MAGN